MSDTAEFTIGAPVACSDAPCGELSRVVVDPVARALTHLVVEPRRRHGLGKLVPIELVQASAETVRLGCDSAEFEALEDAEETHFLSQTGEGLGYGSEDLLAWPHYGLGSGMGGMGMDGLPQTFTYDRVPVGEVDVRRGDQVLASDGPIGHVRGLVIDSEDHHVTHLLLQEGHLWGRRQVAIPIGAVKEVAPGGVEVLLTRAEVRDLAPVALSEDG